jgi:outer membrane protein assembly factor BamB
LKKILSIIIILIFIISSIPIVISDIPITNENNLVWPMKCFDRKHSSISPYSTVDNPMGEKWRYVAKNWIYSGIAIDSDENIYFGDFSGYVHSVTLEGKLRWRSRCGDFSSITSTPLITDEGVLYIGSWDDKFYALNMSNGDGIWYFNAGATIDSSPVIDDNGVIYFGVMEPAIEQIGRLYALYSSNGTEKWHYDTGFYITSDPAVGDDGTIYFGSLDSYFYALNPNGTLKWRFKTGHYIKGPPSINDEGSIFFGSYDDYLYALYPNGTMKWKTVIGTGTETNPSFLPDGTIIVGDDNLYAIYPENGTIKWIYELPGDERIHMSSPTISAEGIIYVGTDIDNVNGGSIIAVNPDGSFRFKKKISNQLIDSSPAIGSDGTVYIGTSSEIQGGYLGLLYAFNEEIINEPPSAPEINGPTTGLEPDVDYPYTFKSIDPDGDDLYYFIWDEVHADSWLGKFASGEEFTFIQSWDYSNTYIISAYAMDDQGHQSEVSTLEVSVPKSIFIDLIKNWIIERFPLISSILNLINNVDDIDIKHDNHIWENEIYKYYSYDE